MTETRPDKTADMLTAVAHWLDLADEAFLMLAALQGKQYERGKTVQQDLLMMAAWLREHPDVDAQMSACVSAFPGE